MAGLAIVLLGIATPAPAQTYNILHTFTGSADGSRPGGLVQDATGNFYGATQLRGASGNGVVFKVDASGKETVLYNFTGGADGSDPFGYPPSGTLVADESGNLYGTTYYGGDLNACPAGCGVVFMVDMHGKETVLHTFSGTDGANPSAGLVRDAAGNFYGTTSNGGTGTVCFNASGCGTVFKLDPSGNETVLYSFSGGVDGSNPAFSLLLDSAGNLYGTTPYGGSGVGVVFKLDSNGNETTLYTFPGPDTGPDGANPVGGLVADASGNLYGTTVHGGTSVCTLFVPSPPPGHLRSIGCGTVFKIDTSGRESILYRFTGGNTSDGAFPATNLALGSSGILYGTTPNGGSQLCFTLSGQTSGCGTVFDVDTSGNEAVLYTFNTVGLDGSFPFNLVRSSVGNLFGSTVSGGADPDHGGGTIFQLIFAPDFSLTNSELKPNPLNAGGSATSIIELVALGTFSDTVNFTCSVQPAPPLAPQCSISPASITPGTPATLTVTTTVPSRAFHSSTGSGIFYALWVPLIGCVAVRTYGPQPKRRIAVLVLGCVLFASLLFQAACGGGSSRKNNGGGARSPGTPPGTYTITIAGVDVSGTLQHSTTATLTVR
jgi:uncharacterized repeat protein (TIGR03803 family)